MSGKAEIALIEILEIKLKNFLNYEQLRLEKSNAFG